MAYCSLAELKGQLGIADADVDGDLDLQRAIDAAAQGIDNACGRTFALDTANQTKLYYPAYSDVLDVVDLVVTASVKTDTVGDRTYATTLATTDYELLPYNEPRAQQIKVWPTSSRGFTPGRLVQVVGKFGYVEGGALGQTTGSTPVPVRQANLLLAARYYARKDSPFGVLALADDGTFARLTQKDPDVAALLGPYSRTQQWVSP